MHIILQLIKNVICYNSEYFVFIKYKIYHNHLSIKVAIGVCVFNNLIFLEFLYQSSLIILVYIYMGYCYNIHTYSLKW